MSNLLHRLHASFRGLLRVADRQAPRHAEDPRGRVDRWHPARIVGWAADGVDGGRHVSVDLRVNGEVVASVVADRPHGDDQHGFEIDPRPYFTQVRNTVEVLFHDSSQRLENGHSDLIDKNADDAAGLLAASQQRWRGDEQDAGLTWGRMMTGDSLVDAFTRHHAFRDDERILEIGPGYGRILRTLLDRDLPFARFLGLELSPARTERLEAEFGGQRVGFVCGDANEWQGEAPFSLVICSSTFEHLYPDCSAALRNLHRQLLPEAVLFIDFIRP